MDNTSLLLLSPPGKFTEFVAAAASMWSPAQFLTVAQVANLSLMEDILQQTGLLSLEMYRINWPGNPAFFIFGIRTETGYGKQDFGFSKRPDIRTNMQQSLQK